MARFIHAVRLLSTAAGVIAVLLLLVALVVVCQLVFVRYVLAASAIWQHETVTFSLIGATFLGAPYVLMTRGHVNVDLLDHYLGPRARLVLALLAAALSFGFCAVIAWVGFGLWWEAWANDWRNETVWAPPLWIPYLAMPLGMTMLCLQYAADLLARVARIDDSATATDRGP